MLFSFINLYTNLKQINVTNFYFCNIEITNLLAVVFITQYVSTIVPSSSLGVAKISVYLFSVSLLCLFSLIGNVLVLDLHNRNVQIDADMPKWV